MAEFDETDMEDFLRVGFTHHCLIIEKTKSVDERLYYIRACAKGMWTVETLLAHLRADDRRHVGALPNNFARTLSPMALATRAVRSFRDEYLLELVNLDNVDATRDQDVDEKMNKGFVEFAVRDKTKPLGIATYSTVRSIPERYKSLAPVIDGVSRVLARRPATAPKPRRRAGSPSTQKKRENALR